MFQWTLTLILVILGTTFAANLPSYLTKCSLKDKRLSTCLVRHANLAIPKVAKGDSYYDIPPLNPLVIQPPIVLKNDNELKFILYNTQIYGLEDTLASSMDFDGKRFNSVFINPSIRILGKYEILGTILNQTIFGNGLANITLERGIYTYNTTFPTQNNYGEIYFDLKNPTFHYETLGTVYCLENLYNGAKFLGAQMNNMLNKYWDTVQKLIEPTTSNIMRDAMTSVFNGIVKNVPVNEIFKP